MKRQNYSTPTLDLIRISSEDIMFLSGEQKEGKEDNIVFGFGDFLTKGTEM